MGMCIQHQFPGQGQRQNQSVITVEGAMQLVMVLPGPRAKAMRVQAADILSRYIQGADSLIKEIEHNKEVGPAAACSEMVQKAVAKVSRYTEMPQVSYVYGSKSDAFPGLIKIGETSDLSSRLTALNTSCAPMPHQIVAVAPTFDSRRDEAVAHAFFASARRMKEFFEVTQEDVRAFFKNHIMAQYQTELMEHIAELQGET